MFTPTAICILYTVYYTVYTEKTANSYECDQVVCRADKSNGYWRIRVDFIFYIFHNEAKDAKKGKPNE